MNLYSFGGQEESIESVLSSSQATGAFKESVRSFLSGGPSERVKVESYAPRVKVRRLLTQLLSAEAPLEVERVVVRAVSGCSDFVGSVDVHTTSDRFTFDFVWCCRWRAEAEGLVDYFGYPDQSRAAHQFDWRCFQKWERRGVPLAGVGAGPEWSPAEG